MSLKNIVAKLIPLFVLAPFAAQAVPSLGVATDNGYICDSGESTCPDPYQTAFGGGVFDGPYFGAEEGFIIGPSGDDLIVFTNIVDADIWLLTDDWVHSKNDPTIDGAALSLLSGTDQFDGYKPTPYWGINLGMVDADWSPLGSEFNPAPFYSLTVTLEYAERFAVGHYFFAVADDNGMAGLQANGIPGPPGPGSRPDSFSPKTTSAVGISEPAPLMLLGLGLLALAFASRRRVSLSTI